MRMVLPVIFQLLLFRYLLLLLCNHHLSGCLLIIDEFLADHRQSVSLLSLSIPPTFISPLFDFALFLPFSFFFMRLFLNKWCLSLLELCRNLSNSRRVTGTAKKYLFVCC